MSGPPTAHTPAPHRGVLVAYAVVAVAQVVAITADLAVLRWLTKPLLVPLLLVWVVLATRPEPPRLLVVGLGFAWLGDLALMVDGDAAFILGLLLFLGMQVCYLTGFARLGAAERLRARPWLPAGFAVMWLALNLALGPSLGALRSPLAVYSLALVAMAATAAALTLRLAVGGALFLVSDLLIGVGAADIDVPATDVLVMATYALAQLLLVTGWVALASRSERSSEYDTRS